MRKSKIDEYTDEDLIKINDELLEAMKDKEDEFHIVLPDGKLLKDFTIETINK